MLFDKCYLKKRLLKNHVVFPPAVCFGWSKNGEMTAEHLEHYRNVVRGGAGLVIAEASCVSADARLAESQLGIWSDEFIGGFAELAAVCHEGAVPLLVQLQHGGIKTVGGEAVAPSSVIDELSGGRYKRGRPVKARELSAADIQKIEDQFVAAAVRIKKAGADGVEIHGAHGYLLSWFLSPDTNKRADRYGGSPEGRAALVSGIMKRTRAECGDDFIIGIRYGGACPGLQDGITLASIFEASGCDLLHISTGAQGETVPVPEKYVEFDSPVYTAIEIKKHVSIPVIASNSVGTIEKAKILVDGGLTDFVSFCRNILADYAWLVKTQQGKAPHTCYRCRPCRWFKKALTACPAQKQNKTTESNR